MIQLGSSKRILRLGYYEQVFNGSLQPVGVASVLPSSRYLKSVVFDVCY